MDMMFSHSCPPSISLSSLVHNVLILSHIDVTTTRTRLCECLCVSAWGVGCGNLLVHTTHSEHTATTFQEKLLLNPHIVGIHFGSQMFHVFIVLVNNNCDRFPIRQSQS